MNAAKNMDSVFSSSEEKELEFDAMFDDDDSIIDTIAGYDEAGNLLTGEDFDWDAFDALGEADNMVGENPDFDYPNDEVGSNYEDSKNRDIDLGGEVGDGKTVSGKEKSAESQAYDDTKEVDDAIGLNDKQQTKLEAMDILDLMEAEDVELGTMDNIKDTEAEKLVCPDCGKYPCECSKHENTMIFDILDLMEADDPITDPCDCGQRLGKVGTGVSDTEGKDQEVIGAALNGSTNEDPIADDIDDADARDGKADSVKDTEGKNVHTVGAALEALDILNIIEETEEAEEPEESDAVEDTEEGCCKEDAVEEPDAVEDTEEGCCKEDAVEGPLEDDDVAEREGEVDDTTVETEAWEVMLDMLDEESSDPIADDIDDADARDGKADSVKDTEGVDQEPVGAALEAMDFLDDIIDEADPDEKIVPDSINLDDFILGDEVVQDLDYDSQIKVAKESAEEDAVDDDQDDDAIEAVDSESDEGESNITSDYEDDDLIDAVINGDIEDL